MLLSIASPFYVSMARITMKNLPDLARFQRRSHADSTFLATFSNADSSFPEEQRYFLDERGGGFQVGVVARAGNDAHDRTRFGSLSCEDAVLLVALARQVEQRRAAGAQDGERFERFRTRGHDVLAGLLERARKSLSLIHI